MPSEVTVALRSSSVHLTQLEACHCRHRTPGGVFQPPWKRVCLSEFSGLIERVVWEMAAGDDSTTKAVGPYLLQRTLGKGQTGRRLVGL